MLSGLTAFSQLQSDFNDSDLSNWAGDIDHFVVNQNFELQLMAESAGRSVIYTPVSFPDSLIWNIDVKLSFSPSTSNSLKVLLAAETPDIVSGTAYVLEVGESGSDDAIQFVKYEDGNPTLIASGITGNVASAFELRLTLEKQSDDMWILRTTDLNSQATEEEFMVLFQEDNIMQMNFFGLICEYTSSRTDLFAFDNVKIEAIVPDIEGPQLLSFELAAEDKIVLHFDEALDPASAKIVSNYQMSGGVTISSVVYDDTESSSLCIVLGQKLLSGVSYLLTLSDIEDVFGNRMTQQSIPIELIVPPSPGDLLINEILFDPYSEGEDFVEVINAGSKTLQLEGLIIRNADKDEDEIINNSLILKSGEIVAFTEDVTAQNAIYNPPDTARIEFQDIPSFNNSDGNISLLININGQDVLLDSFDYKEDMHLSLISDTEGVSLERISLISSSNDINNWTSSAASNLYATPGYANSSRSNPMPDIEEMVYLEHKVFSPDNDGFKDQMILHYNLDQPGYIANIVVYDDHGRRERFLARNQLLGTEGILTWDGTLEDGRIAPIGMYIIQFEFFNVAGDRLNGKKVVVLAQNLND